MEPDDKENLVFKKQSEACNEEETSANVGYCRILKKLIDCQRIPAHFEHLEWKTFDLDAVFGNFAGLPEFLFRHFYSCQLLDEEKDHTPTPTFKQENDLPGEEVSPLDLTGCPLECPFEFSHFEDNVSQATKQNGEANKLPLLVCKAEYARLFINIYIHTIYKSLSTPLPVMLLCDGTDSLRTTLLAAFKSYNTVTHIQATKLSGTFSEKSVPSIGSFKSELLKMVPGKPAVTEMEASAEYDILVSKSESFNALRIHCHWVDPLALLEPPSINSLCRLDVNIFPGEEQAALSLLYKDLSILKSIVEGLNCGEIQWSIEKDNDKEPMSSRVEHLIKVTKDVRPSQGHAKKSVEVGDSSDLKTYIEVILFSKRQHLDFTDNLWNTLMYSSSYNEVKEGLSYVAKALSGGEINPVILRNNKTSLGCWIKNRARGQEELLLDGLEPLKHLGEIGLHKLQEDYCSLFLGLELATREMLSPFLQSWEEKEEAVKSLCLLHATLELVLLCKVYLDLPQYLLGVFSRQVLENHKYQPTDKYKFSFQVPLNALQKKLSNLSPDEWQISCKSSSAILTAKTSLHFAKTLLPHLRPTSPSDTAEDNEYYATKYICLEYNM